jgi:hypothetical protein
MPWRPTGLWAVKDLTGLQGWALASKELHMELFLMIEFINKRYPVYIWRQYALRDTQSQLELPNCKPWEIPNVDAQ